MMVVVSTMGFRDRTQADTSDDHHERSDGKTLNNDMGRRWTEKNVFRLWL